MTCRHVVSKNNKKNRFTNSSRVLTIFNTSYCTWEFISQQIDDCITLLVRFAFYFKMHSVSCETNFRNH